MRKISAFLLSVILIMAWSPAVADGYSDMLAKAENYLASADYPKAIASYQLARKLQPDHEQAFLGEASVHMILEDYSSAASLIDAALEKNPVSPDAWRLKCKVDVLSGDLSALEQDIVFAEVCEADLTDLYPQIASLYASAGVYEKAVSCFQMADLHSLDETQLELYRKALVLCGKREEAESLGLGASSKKNDALDAAFDHDDLTLVKTDFPVLDAADFEFPDEMWEAAGIKKPADPTAELSAILPSMSISWLSLSPAGNSGILVTDVYNGVCYYAGKYHILYPSAARGVEDTNGNLAKVFSLRLQSLLGEEGVVYSPDGRYAAIYNFRYTMNMRFILDPIIIDLSTGEMFLSATYENNLFKPGSGAVSTAAFSSDGRYLYYIFYGNTAKNRTALYRYSLREGTTELCYSGSDFYYYPTLSETADGTFVILRDTQNQQQTAGLTGISYINGVWMGKELSFDLPMRYWYCNRLMLSANSGYAFIPGSMPALSGVYYAFQRVRPDDDFAGMNQYYVISEESNQIQAYSAGELSSLFERRTNESDQTAAPFSSLDLPFQDICNFTLSPDGHYVLLYTVSDGPRENRATTRHLYLVRLDDLVIKEVRGIDPASIQAGAFAGKYRPVIEWNTDTLIVGTSDGPQAYTFRLRESD